jgi:hypothetical protein
MITNLTATGLVTSNVKTALTKATTPDEFVRQLNLYGLEDTAAAKAQGSPCS